MKLQKTVLVSACFVILVLLGLGAAAFADERKRLTAPTVNKHATDSAKQLLQLLYDIKGHYTLAGQHNFIEAPDYWTNVAIRLTGRTPVLKGYEMGAIQNQTEEKLYEQRAKIADNAIAWHKAGGIVAMTFHINQPGQCYCWDKINNGGISAERFKEIITPGTDLYKAHIADLDRAAEHLKKLRDAGVPVLWRPYHEMNGGWFWWGKQAEFEKLWEIMYERFTKVHKLHNLLWVWSAGPPDEWADDFEPYYVGPTRADVLALDIYYNRFEQKFHDQLTELASGKPIAIGENGGLPDPEALRLHQTGYVWFMTWGETIRDDNSPGWVKKLYEHERIITREELSELKER